MTTNSTGPAAYRAAIQPADFYATVIRNAFKDYQTRFADITRREAAARGATEVKCSEFADEIIKQL